MKTLKGILVANGYMRTEKFEEITQIYVEASRKTEIDLKVYYTDQLAFGFDSTNQTLLKGIEEDIDFVVFLDKDIMLAKQFEKKGIRVFNNSEVIRGCDNKGLTMLELADCEIPMPKTLIAPLVFEGTYESEKEDRYIEKLEAYLGYPIVVKESFGSFGQQVYLANNKKELETLRKRLVYKPHLYQEMITSSRGKDMRIHVVGNQVVAAMLRFNEKDFRANISSGGQMNPIDPPEAFKALALKVCKQLGADFAGVDLLFGEKGNPILCEVNSNAHIKNILECTGVNVAEHIMAYIREEMTKDERVSDL